MSGLKPWCLLSLLSLSACATTDTAHLQKTLDKCNEDYRALALSMQTAAKESPPAPQPPQPKQQPCPACPAVAGAAPKITTEVLRQQLDSLELRWEAREELTIVPFDLGDTTFRVVLRVREGDRLDILLPNIGKLDLRKAPPARLRSGMVALAYLMNLNYQHPFVRYAWDKSDGEVRAIINLPLEENIQATTLRIYVATLLEIVIKKDKIPEVLGRMASLSEEEALRMLEMEGGAPTPEPQSGGQRKENGFDF